MSVQTPNLRFADSFEHYGTGIDTTVLMAKKWTGIQNSVISNVGRTGLGATLGSLRKTLSYENRWTAGWGFRITGLTGGNFGNGSLYDLSAVSTSHVFVSLYSVRIEPDGTISLYSGGSKAVQSVPALHQNVWYYFENEIILQGHAISTNTFSEVIATLYLNGMPFITSGTALGDVNVTSILAGDVLADGHTFSGASVGQSYTDDVYIASFPPSWPGARYYGPVKILAVYPNADVTTQWQTSSGTTHFNLINDTSTTGTAPNETTYIYSTNTTSGSNTDLWDWQDISTFVGVICGIQYSLYAKKDDFGIRVINHLFGTATAVTTSTASGHPITTDIGTSTDNVLADDYVYYHIPLDYNPDTVLAWTPVSFNTHRFGVNLGTNIAVTVIP